MKITHRRPDSYGVVTTLVIALSVWLVQASGLLQNSDDRLSDFVNAFSARSYNRSNVLLVYAPEAILQSDDQQLADLIHTINDFQPAKVGIAYALGQSQLQRLGSMPCAANVVAGHMRNDASSTVASTSNATAAIQSGFLDLYLDGQPIHRKHIGNNGTSSNPQWSFEALIANQVARSSNTIPPGVLRIRFESGPNGLPHVQSQDFVNGRIIPELVRDRVVLIGPARSDEVGFITPTTSGSERMSALELRGNALQSLRSGNHIGQLSQLGVLGLVGLIAFVIVQWLRNISNRWMHRICLLASIVICISAWFALSKWSLQLPVSAMLLTTCFAFVGVLHCRYRALKELVENWRLLRHTSDRFTTTRPEQDAWSSLAVSMKQVFFPRRMVLMELAPGTTHLKVVKLHDCDESDIAEKRRDISRAPYRTAVEQAYPLRSDGRNFFNTSEDHGCVEFVVPLIVVSELVGFMILELDQVAIDQWGDFEETLSQYAGEMAIFLATHSNHRDGTRAQRVINRIELLPERLMAVSLYKDEIEHRRVEQMLNEALESSETSLAVCDIFGRLVKANAKMISLLQHEDVPSEELNCVDMLVALTNQDPGECRKIFRRCIVEKLAERIVLPSKSADQSFSVMFVKPLSQNEFDAGGGIESQFVAVEVISGEAFQQINHWQEAFLKSHNAKTQEQLELLQSIAGDLEIAKRSRDESVDPYVEIASEVLETVNQAKEAAGVDLSRSAANSLMLCSKTILDSSLRQSSPSREARGVKLSQRFPDQISDVLGNPFCLERTFSNVIECLIQECDDQTKLVVSATESDGQVTYQFSTRPDTAMLEGLDLNFITNAGGENTDNDDAHGNNSLHAAQDTLLSNSQLDRFSESQRWLNSWGGEIDVQCDACFRVAISVTLSTTPQDPLSLAAISLKTPTGSQEVNG